MVVAAGSLIPIPAQAAVVGPMGPMGVTGLLGTSGPVSPSGVTGVTEPRGATGATGPLGPIGTSGVTGVSEAPAVSSVELATLQSALLAQELAASQVAEAAARADRDAAAYTLQSAEKVERAARERRAVLVGLQLQLALSAYRGRNPAVTALATIMTDGPLMAAKARKYAGAAALVLRERLAAASGDVARAHIATRNARSSLTERRDALNELTTRNAALTTADIGSIGTVPSSRGVGPTILGLATLNVDELVAFSRTRGVVRTTVPIEELARYFLEEGAYEGVRGDIAFAQAILETGNFGFEGSMVAPRQNNFGGMGACDSCRTGTTFATARLGVRAQMQLLHAYADPGLTTATLANPRVPGVDPDTLWVRGCCQTWIDMDGVWATGRFYGEHILSIYGEMLRAALAARSVDPKETSIPVIGPTGVTGVTGPTG